MKMDTISTFPLIEAVSINYQRAHISLVNMNNSGVVQKYAFKKTNRKVAALK